MQFPVATKAAYASDPGSEDLMLQVIASILSGSVFGDHVTPISDTTILSSLASRCACSHACCCKSPVMHLAASHHVYICRACCCKRCVLSLARQHHGHL